MRGLAVTLALLAAASPAVAQHQHDPDQTPAHAHAMGIPDGWQARLDRASATLSDVHAMQMDDHLHVMTGPALILWQPETTATGAYRAHASFTLNKPSAHPEAFGLILGGHDLEGPDQDYLYFLVRQDGKFLVKHRAGDAETHTLFEWTENDAIHRPGDDGTATNELAMDVSEAGVRFLVNGTEVARLDRVSYLNTEGIVGLRVNHNLDVMVRDFGVAPAP